MSATTSAAPGPVHGLDPSLYSTNLSQADLTFFKQAAGFVDEDDEKIKEHVMAVQAKAYAVYSYPCIRRFGFIRPRIASLPGYKRALELLDTRTDPILVDIGCCFGNDIRKAVLDGWPAQNIVGSDLRKGFWDVGHELFNSTPQSFPVTFLEGNVFDDTFLSIDSVNISTATINTITSLTPLVKRVSAIHTSALFHLFPEDQQLALARRLAALLIPLPGSIIFGQHNAYPTSGPSKSANVRVPNEPGKTFPMFFHSPESWEKLWKEDVFGDDASGGSEPAIVNARVIVKAELKEVKNDIMLGKENTLWVMSWSVQIA